MDLLKRMKELEKENEELKNSFSKLSKEHSCLKQDYNTLISIMDRVKKLGN